MNSKAESWEDRERKKPSSILSGTSPRLLLHAESLHRRLSVRREAGRSLFGPALKCANKVGPGEVSAAGTPGETGLSSCSTYRRRVMRPKLTASPGAYYWPLTESQLGNCRIS